MGTPDVVVGGGGLEGIVGIAASGHEVIGGNGVNSLFVKGLAAYGLDGDTVDALGCVIGGVGIKRTGVIALAGVNGELNAADLREAAQRVRRTVGGCLQRLQQLRAGDLDDAQGVAEGQDGVDVLLGDVPRP